LNDYSNANNSSKLKLYYSVLKGRREEINLRDDVWIRSTDTNSGKHPRFSCHRGFGWAIIGFFLGPGICLLIAILFGILCDIVKLINRYTGQTYCEYSASCITRFCQRYFDEECCNWCMYAISCPFLLMTPAAIATYQFFASYGAGGMRCKNDGMFLWIVIYGGIMIFLICVAYCIIIYNKKKHKRTKNEEDIEMATRKPTVYESKPKKVKEKKEVKIIGIEVNSNDVAPPFTTREVFDNLTEYSICVNPFTLTRPGVVTESGDVWCSECFGKFSKK
jgi:hypothetical protein